MRQQSEQLGCELFIAGIPVVDEILRFTCPNINCPAHYLDRCAFVDVGTDQLLIPFCKHRQSTTGAYRSLRNKRNAAHFTVGISIVASEDKLCLNAVAASGLQRHEVLS